jgi:hypothetical protein
LKGMADAKATDARLNVIPEADEDSEVAEAAETVFTNDDLQIIIHQKEVKKSKCYKLPQQKVIIT